MTDRLEANIPRLAWMHVFSSAQFHLVVFTTLSPLLGYAVDVYSLPTALLLMGLALIVTAGGFALAYRSRHTSGGTASRRRSARSRPGPAT
jgi:hypothetical protein